MRRIFYPYIKYKPHYTGKLPKKPSGAAAGVALGCILILVGFISGAMGLLPFLVGAIAIALSVLTAIIDVFVRAGRGLVIEINTGITYGFKSYDTEFAVRVADQIERIISGEATAINMTADFERGTLS